MQTPNRIIVSWESFLNLKFKFNNNEKTYLFP
nr:MAG TPA: hypothetical protein [Caudoviricetes sp.]